MWLYYEATKATHPTAETQLTPTLNYFTAVAPILVSFIHFLSIGFSRQNNDGVRFTAGSCGDRSFGRPAGFPVEHEPEGAALPKIHDLCRRVHGFGDSTHSTHAVPAEGQQKCTVKYMLFLAQRKE